MRASRAGRAGEEPRREAARGAAALGKGGEDEQPAGGGARGAGSCGWGEVGLCETDRSHPDTDGSGFFFFIFFKN